MRPNFITIACKTCGQPFRRSVSAAQRGGSFCSRPCYWTYEPTPEEMKASLLARVRIDPQTGCWLWQGGSTSNGGYGFITHRRRKVRVHRIAWELFRGPIPEGVEVCHDCPGGDNPACCNPAHLFLGTHADNMADMAKKGRANSRSPEGEANHAARLTEAQVREMRILYAQDKRIAPLVARFGVSETAVKCVVYRKTWKHLP